MRKKNWGHLFLASMLLILMVFSVAGCGTSQPTSANQASQAAPAKNAATDWPSKPVAFVVHTGPGPLDTAIRTLASLSESEIGKPIVIENRPGGSGATAMSYAISQPTDGYTFLSVTGSTSFNIAEGSMPFKADDFTFIRSFQGEPTTVAVRKDSPLKTMDDFMKAMKANPKQFKVGGYASAGFHQFIYYQLEQVGGFNSAWIPYDAGGDVAVNLLGGHIDVAIMTPSSAVSQVKSGEIRLLGISSSERSKFFPDVPTFKELGYNVQGLLWRGIMAKKGVPPEIIAKLNAAVDKAIAKPEWTKYMELNMQEVDNTQGDKLAQVVNQEITERTKFLKEIGVKK